MLFIIAAAQKICKNNLKSAKKTENFPGRSPFFAVRIGYRTPPVVS